MKKIFVWLLTFLLTGVMILFCVSFLGQQAIIPAMNEEGAPVSDAVVREETRLVGERIQTLADLYGFPAEQAVSVAGEDTIRDLNAQASRWWSSILLTGRPTEKISWNAELQLPAEEAEADIPETENEAQNLAAAGLEEVRRGVIRTVLPVRQEVIEPGLQKVRKRIDLPNLLAFAVGMPWAALALCALLAGLIALLESRKIRLSLQYIGAALGAAAIVLVATGVLFQYAGIESMIREASESLTVLYREVLSQTAVRAAVMTAVMAAGCILCMTLSRRKEKTV